MEVDFKGFPVLDTLELQAITFDAVKFDDDSYGAIINFWKVFPIGELKEQEPEGLIFCTQIIDEDLPSLYKKILAIIETGMLEGPTIYLNGNMWSHDGELIGEVSWIDYSDDYYLISELEDSVPETLDETTDDSDDEFGILKTHHKPPRTIQ
jgi:hypothetical protein